MGLLPLGFEGALPRNIPRLGRFGSGLRRGCRIPVGSSSLVALELVAGVLPVGLPLPPSLEGEETRLAVQQMPWFRGDEYYFSVVDAHFFEEAAGAGVMDAAPGVAGEEFFSCVGLWFRNVSP